MSEGAELRGDGAAAQEGGLLASAARPCALTTVAAPGLVVEPTLQTPEPARSPLNGGSGGAASAAKPFAVPTAVSLGIVAQPSMQTPAARPAGERSAIQAPEATRPWSEETDGRVCLRIGFESVPALAADSAGNALFPASLVCSAVGKLQDKDFADGGIKRKLCMNSGSGVFRGDSSHFRFVPESGRERRVVSVDQANMMFAAVRVGAMTIASIFSSLFAATAAAPAPGLAVPAPPTLASVPHDVLVKFIELNPHIATQALCLSTSRACADAVSVVVQKRFSDRRPAMEDAVAKIALNMSSGDANDVVFPVNPTS